MASNGTLAATIAEMIRSLTDEQAAARVETKGGVDEADLVSVLLQKQDAEIETASSGDSPTPLADVLEKERK